MENIKLNINPADLPSVICSCGNPYWVHANILKKVSKIVSPNGEEGVIPIPDMICSKCGSSVQEAMRDDEPTKPKLHLV